MGLRRFEKRLEHLVEGTFARVFKSGLNPVEIARRIIREIDANQTVSVDGSLAVPNHFWVFVSSADHDRLSDVQTHLRRELAETAADHIRAEGYRVLGPVSVALVEAPDYPEGTLQVQAQWRERAERQGQATLVLEGGERIALGLRPFTIGRMPGSSLVLNDDSVSRNHAVIRPGLGGWLITDLGSTNGTLVNGAVVTESKLQPGDRIVFGSIEAAFRMG